MPGLALIIVFNQHATQTSWRDGVCHGTGVLLLAAAEGHPGSQTKAEQVKEDICTAAERIFVLLASDFVMTLDLTPGSVLCPQVSGDHQYPGWADFSSGSSQPGQEAVGPGCWLRLFGVLQPQQTWGTSTPVLNLAFSMEFRPNLEQCWQYYSLTFLSINECSQSTNKNVNAKQVELQWSVGLFGLFKWMQALLDKHKGQLQPLTQVKNAKLVN